MVGVTRSDRGAERRPRAGKSSIVAVIQEVLRWQNDVHVPGRYDLEVDTSVLNPEQCADAIRRRLDDGAPPTAFRQLAAAT
jgi:chloramphenicol 3-O phosphotransferase